MALKLKIEGSDEAFENMQKAEELEVKTEVKAEVKEELMEMKEELLEEEAKKGKKDKKDKKDKKRKAEDMEDGEDGQSDGEYDKVDLSKCPQSLVIKESGGHKNIEGSYNIMKEAVHGKPCYECQGPKKTAYIFFAKGGWRISYELKSSQVVAKCEDAKLLAPCEPYPFAWQVIDRKTNKEDSSKRAFVMQLAMRVIDGANASLVNDEEALGLEGAAAERRSRRPHISGKTKRKERKLVVRTAEEAASPRAPSAKAAASSKKVQDEEEDDDLGPPSDEAEEVEQESESVSDSDSDSDSGQSSSSSQQAAAPPKAKPAPVTPIISADREAMEKRKLFCSKIELQLSKLGASQRGVKIGQLRQMLTGEKFEQTRKASGMDQETLAAFLNKLERDHQKQVGGPKAYPPGTPIPRWMLDKQKEGHAAAATPGAVPQPTTPTEEDRMHERSAAMQASTNQPLHKTLNPTRSAMRPQWKQRPSLSERRLKFPVQESMRREVPIVSFRNCGEALWFIMPGAIVCCDMCGKGVPQSMGSLQGAPGQSQFAQNSFLCTDCMGLSFQRGDAGDLL